MCGLPYSSTSPRSCDKARRNQLLSAFGAVNEMSVRGVMISFSTSAGGFTYPSVFKISSGFHPELPVLPWAASEAAESEAISVSANVVATTERRAVMQTPLEGCGRFHRIRHMRPVRCPGGATGA